MIDLSPLNDLAEEWAIARRRLDEAEKAQDAAKEAVEEAYQVAKLASATFNERLTALVRGTA